MSTPIRAQHLRLKRAFHDALLLFRLGAFYELYGHDATITAYELGVTLTIREFAGGERMSLCPLPYHSFEGHIKRLVACGYKVAIAEQIRDPRTAKGLIEREAVRVVTPESAITAQRHPSSGRMGDSSVGWPDRSARTRSSWRMVAPVPPTSSDGRAAAPASASNEGREERAAAPAVQLALFEPPAGGGGRGR